MTATRAPGHSFKGIESNVYNDRRYVCECGDRGAPVSTVVDARGDHRLHKLQVTTLHRYRKARRQFGPICGECGQPEVDSVHISKEAVT
jgi:hypothetical protein